MGRILKFCLWLSLFLLVFAIWSDIFLLSCFEKYPNSSLREMGLKKDVLTFFEAISQDFYDKVNKNHYIQSIRPLLIAHRGSRGLNPENTMNAHVAGMKIGADVLEMDVRLTKDNRLVVFHDSSLERVTNGEGLVSSYTLEELQTFDAGYLYTIDYGKTFPTRGLGYRIPSFQEFLAMFAPSNVSVSIEIKDNQLLAADILYKELKVWEDEINMDNWSVASRFCDVSDRLRELYGGDIVTGACEGEVVSFLLRMWFRVTILSSKFFPLRNDFFQIPYESQGYILSTEHLVRHAHSIGKKVHFWTINDPVFTDELLKIGVDGIVTDRADTLLPVFGQYGHPMADMSKHLGTHREGEREEKRGEEGEEEKEREGEGKGKEENKRLFYLPITSDSFLPKKNNDNVHACVTVACIMVVVFSKLNEDLISVICYFVFFLILFSFLKTIHLFKLCIYSIFRKKKVEKEKTK